MPEFDSTIQYRDIQGAPGYMAGSDGSVWSCWKQVACGHRGGAKYGISSIWKRLKSKRNRDGRPQLTVRLNNRRQQCCVHKLVLLAFVGPCPPGMECCHDPDPDRANNQLANLRWDNRKSNHQDKVKHGTMPYGARSGTSKLTDEKVLEIRSRLKNGESPYRIAECFDVSYFTVRLIRMRKTWRHLP